MREGLRTGFVQPKVILQGFEDTITTHLVSDLEKSVFWKPFAVLSQRRARGRSDAAPQAGRAAIEKDVLPVYRALLEFMTKEYMPKARAHASGPRELPQGREYYALLRAALHDPRHHPRPGPRARPRRRWRGSAPRWTQVLKQVEVGEELPAVPRVPAHRPALLPEDRRGAAEGSARTSPRRWTASSRASSRRCRASPTGSSPCPPTSRPSTPRAATAARRSRSTRAGMYWVNTHALPHPHALHPRGADPPRGGARATTCRSRCSRS